MFIALGLCAIVAQVVSGNTQKANPSITASPVPSGIEVHEQLVERGCVTTTHVVQQGDTLQGLAEQWGIGVCNIAVSNNIPDISRIWVQQTLRARQAGCNDPITTPPCTLPSAPQTTHVAVAGDNLWDLAVSRGVPVSSMIAANPALATASIQPGQVVTIVARK